MASNSFWKVLKRKRKKEFLWSDFFIRVASLLIAHPKCHPSPDIHYGNLLHDTSPGDRFAPENAYAACSSLAFHVLA